MESKAAAEFLIDAIANCYGESEAHSISRIVMEDAFGVFHQRSRWLDEHEVNTLHKIVERLKNHEPVQYIVGKALFYGHYYRVTPHTLIPRQETEELVEWVARSIRERQKEVPRFQTPRLFDIGLGTGCIGIGVKLLRPETQLFGVEYSPEALEIAVENAGRLLQNQPFHFMQGDILHRPDWDRLGGPFDVIVSNPHYIPPSEIDLMPENVWRHEPRLALFVEEDKPLTFYEQIAAFALAHMTPQGMLFFECNEFNAPQVVDLLQKTGFSDVKLQRDLRGAQRMIRATRSN